MIYPKFCDKKYNINSVTMLLFMGIYHKDTREACGVVMKEELGSRENLSEL